MNKIYEDANDQHVVGTYVYVKNNKVYIDSKCTESISAEDLKNLFYKGLILVDDTKEYKPLSMVTSGNSIGLTYLTTDGSTTNAKIITVYSKEHV